MQRHQVCVLIGVSPPIGADGGRVSGGAGALLARPLRLPKLQYRFLGSRDQSL